MDEVGQMPELSRIKSKDEKGEHNITNAGGEEEDNWEDILAEQKDWEKNPNKEKFNKKQEQYNALADFNKLLREEEAKLKDKHLLKEVDLAQKLKNMGKPIMIPQRGSVEHELQGNMEERKINDIDDSIPLENSEGKGPKLVRRHSTAPENTLLRDSKRRYSLRTMNNQEIIQHMEAFKIGFLDPSHQKKADQIINSLKQSSVVKKMPAKVKHTRTKSPQESKVQPTGWGPWEELWEFKKEAIRQKSPFGHFKSYKLRCLIVKAADDLRQELLAMQLIRKIEQIWKEAGLKLYVRAYDILVTSEDSGILGKNLRPLFSYSRICS